MSDLGHDMTDEELSDLEKRIANEYKKAADDLADTIDAYFEALEERDKKMLALLEKGKITEQEYTQWRLAQIGRGKRFEALRDQMAERYTKANEVAVAYINDATPGIYSLNYNFSAYTIEQQAGNIGFNLMDEQTVKRLIVEQPDIMPYYPPKRALRRGIDLAYGKRQITAQVTQGILQGLSVQNIADKLQQNIPNMERVSAVRAARTAVTGAQNAGRYDGYRAAKEMGIDLQAEWLATLDNRTRHAHGMLDGQRREIGEPFEVDGMKIMFPGCPSVGDKMVVGSLIYNCRCTLIAALKDVDTSDAKRRARDPVTGKSEVIENMTYQEWYAMKERQHGTEAMEKARKKVERKSADKKQYEEYQKILKGNAPKTFEKFQDLKYNNPEGWAQLKAFRRYKGQVPEATSKDFQKYLEVKATDVKGTVRVPPEKIDAAKLTFRDEHAARHGCTEQQARGYVENAYCSIEKERWDGVSINYYSANGATYVDKSTMEIKTSFNRKDYDTDTKAIVEVFE